MILKRPVATSSENVKTFSVSVRHDLCHLTFSTKNVLFLRLGESVIIDIILSSAHSMILLTDDSIPFGSFCFF